MSLDLGGREEDSLIPQQGHGHNSGQPRLVKQKPREMRSPFEAINVSHSPSVIFLNHIYYQDIMPSLRLEVSGTEK